MIRDPAGDCLASSHCYIAHVLDAPTAEAMALRNGLQLALQTGFNRFTIQTDYMAVVNTMMDGGFKNYCKRKQIKASR